MKKILTLLFLTVLFCAGCQKNDASEQAKYRLQCLKNDEIACAKFLFLKSWADVKNESYTTNLDKQDWNYWKNRYLNKITTEADAYVAIETMLSSLDDPYTRFLTPEELEDQNMNIASQLSGIGVVISTTDGKITVEDVMPDSPASKNDLKIGDLIMKIDNISTSGFDIRKVAKMIRGPIGTQVQLTILRNNDLLNKTITRDKIVLKAVDFKMLENNIAYIKISTFMSQAASAEFLNALQQTKEAEKMIIDLRGNQGGLLQNATFIANILLKNGKIVSILRKNNISETINVQPAGFHIDKPMVVLTNGFSASAGEILAAALQENDRAILVGEKTFGKGLIQKIIPLPMNTAMNVTIAKYLTPDGHDINKNGIKPDYNIKLDEKAFLQGKDNQLEKALEILTNEKISLNQESK